MKTRHVALFAGLALAAVAVITPAKFNPLKFQEPEVLVTIASTGEEIDLNASDEIDVPFFEVNEAYAAGTETFGDLEVNYYTNGKTEFIIKNPSVSSNILFYAVLTSAETSSLRGVYNDVRTATGGLTAAGNNATDGTTTIPSRPTFGDLTD